MKFTESRKGKKAGSKEARDLKKAEREEEPPNRRAVFGSLFVGRF